MTEQRYKKLWLNLIYPILLAISASVISCQNTNDEEIEQLISEPCEIESISAEGVKTCYKNIDGKRYIFEYHDDKNLMSINEVEINEDNQTILNGRVIEFYSNGEVESKFFYKNNVPNGPVTFYYKNGKVKNEGKYLNNIIVDVSKVYFEEGGLEYYVVHDKDGNTRYYRQYDKSGKVIREEGDAIAYTTVNLNPATLKINDTLVCKYFVAHPPNTTLKFKIANAPNKNINIKDNIAIYKSIYKKAGKYNITGVLEIKDMKDGTIKTDTIKNDVVVR